MHGAVNKCNLKSIKYRNSLIICGAGLHVKLKHNKSNKTAYFLTCWNSLSESDMYQ